MEDDYRGKVGDIAVHFRGSEDLLVERPSVEPRVRHVAVSERLGPGPGRAQRVFIRVGQLCAGSGFLQTVILRVRKYQLVLAGRRFALSDAERCVRSCEHRGSQKKKGGPVAVLRSARRGVALDHASHATRFSS